MKATREAVAELGLDATIEKVTNYAEIMNYGVRRTPGLVVDEKVVLPRRVPTTQTVKDLRAARLESGCVYRASIRSARSRGGPGGGITP